MLAYLKFLLGGGQLKYRVRGVRVEMKGGGNGPFWGFAHFSAFDSPERAMDFAHRWSSQHGGIVVED
jgi:hypothetical protein